MGILQKINKVRESIGAIEKTGYNEKNDFWFFSESDILNGVKNAMQENGVITSLEYITHEFDNRYDSNGRNRTRLFAHVNFTFTDVDTGETWSTQASATGSGIGDDVATRKTHTQLKKIVFLDTFLITDSDSRVDADSLGEAEPMSMAPEAPKAATLNELVAEVGAYVSDKESPVTGAHVGAIGKRLAKENGVSDSTIEWKKSEVVMAGVLAALKQGLVE